MAAWAWEDDIIETLPRFPKPRSQRDVAGRKYLIKAELNALYSDIAKEFGLVQIDERLREVEAKQILARK